jgi:hypothetical protein
MQERTASRRSVVPVTNPRENRSGVLQWVIVLGVGALVVTVVLALNLIPRLSDGQKVLNGARPAFTNQRLAADVAGINIISRDVNMADPIVTAAGGGASEVPALVGFAAKQLHVTPAVALATMKKDFPHTVALLSATPLSSVTAELPKLIAFLASTLKLSQAQVPAAVKANFPALYQAITNLPTVTNGWNQIPHLGGLTRFNGTPVKTVPQLRDYFKSDLIPAVAAQQKNFQSLDGTSSVNWIAPLLLIVGLIVMAFGAVMIFRNRRGVSSRAEAIGTAAVVPVVGVVVVALVLVLALVPRTSDGQKLLDGLKPAWSAHRTVGDRGGINMVSAIGNTEDPIMTPSGGASNEVPKLIAFVSSKTGLTQAQVVAALAQNFPHTTALLESLPLTAVTKELTGVVQALGPGVVTAVPRLAQTVLNAPYVTSGWDNVPGTAGTTRFNGSPIKTVPQIRDYFSADVIPVLENQLGNYNSLTKTSNIDFIGPLVLIVGFIVIIYGLIMVALARGVELPARSRPAGAARSPAAVT